MHGLRRDLRIHFGLGLLAVALVTAGGCLKSTTDVDPAAPATSGAAAISMQQIREKVSMTDDQAAQLAPAFDRWQQAERSGSLDFEDPEWESPALRFVLESAAVLDRPQLVQLLRVVREQRAVGARGPMGPGRDGMGPGGEHRRGPGNPPPGGGHRRHPGGPGGGFPGGPHGGGPFADLGLTPQQRQDIRDARIVMHDAVQAARADFDNGTITEEQFQGAVRQAREAFHAAVLEVLTPEQEQLLEQKQTTQLVRRLQHQIDNFATASARRMDVLTRVLGLDAGQAQSIGDIVNSALPQLETLLAGLQGGTLSAADARTALHDLRQAQHDGIVALLTPDQAELFEELARLHRQGRHGGPRG